MEKQQIPSQESTSLLHRLAGPSAGKAGLAKDQSDINRIIAEVSRGSKFYENEKKKDKMVTERINKLLEIQNEALKGADIPKLEASADQLLVELETHRDLSQTIVHVDMDAFYANVELLDNPNLAGKAFGASVLCTASYEARKFGVRSGMAGFVAKKLCPELLLLPLRFDRYTEMSNKIMDVFSQYDPTMLPAGCDEGYLNITAYCSEHGITTEDCVQEMRQRVFQETKLTVSAGIAPNKMLAKICSDKNKPNGQFILPFDRQSIMAFMRELSIRKIPGIGRVNERLLEAVGIKTCGDIYTHRAIIALLDKQLGLRFLLRTYLGISSNVVRPYEREECKSVGVERTFSPLSDKHQILKILGKIAISLEEDLKESGWIGKTVTLKYKLDTYQVFTRAKSFNRWISKKEDLFATGQELLFKEFPQKLPKLRLIGLRVTKLKDLRAPATGIEREQEDEEAMPGFHEHNEIDGVTQYEVDEDIELLGDEMKSNHALGKPVASSSSSKPVSARASTSKDTKIPMRLSPPRAVGKVESQECPICGRMLDMDNQTFNGHIDFCLSRGAILEAQSQASRMNNRGWGFLKADSSGGKGKKEREKRKR
ncbi:hypothetical protein BDQ17DRAFT_1299087 [Cyathus striatus]|nr:hypothetical protein BDQ17DRAFT_1299087 [Cyathus striatus]